MSYHELGTDPFYMSDEDFDEDDFEDEEDVDDDEDYEDDEFEKPKRKKASPVKKKEKQAKKLKLGTNKPSTLTVPDNTPTKPKPRLEQFSEAEKQESPNRNPVNKSPLTSIAQEHSISSVAIANSKSNGESSEVEFRNEVEIHKPQSTHRASQEDNAASDSDGDTESEAVLEVDDQIVPQTSIVEQKSAIASTQSIKHENKNKVNVKLNLTSESSKIDESKTSSKLAKQPIKYPPGPGCSKVGRYLVNQNRPFSITDLTRKFKGQLSRGEITKSIEKLSEAGIVTSSADNKIYWANQELFESGNISKLIEANLKREQELVSSARTTREQIAAMKPVILQLTAEPASGQIQDALKTAREKNIKLKAKLESTQSETSKVVAVDTSLPSDSAELHDMFRFFKNAWRDMKLTVTDMCKDMLEGLAKKTSLASTFEDIGIESDENHGVVLREVTFPA